MQCTFISTIMIFFSRYKKKKKRKNSKTLMWNIDASGLFTCEIVMQIPDIL